MRASFRLNQIVSDKAVFNKVAATTSIAILLCGPGGVAPSNAATPAGDRSTSLPNITVEAPRQVTSPHRPSKRAAVHRAPSARSSTISTSCIDGCVSSFRSGDRPWVGCSVSGQYAYSTTCRNPANFKNYNQCLEAGLNAGWRSVEASWYCHSLAASNSYSENKTRQ
ncbi:hypothetical protein [Bradyrhizobium sp. 6(2017)]|uniref:hypothetical protein n=1 Tax=Bradyrhizobium sp. 6(2017) TaxID=1197460 RepID=UPI000406641F|nr:hypothetical protein [Bradyrhizobium sp. 6(2017)]